MQASHSTGGACWEPAVLFRRNCMLQPQSLKENTSTRVKLITGQFGRPLLKHIAQINLKKINNVTLIQLHKMLSTSGIWRMSITGEDFTHLQSLPGHKTSPDGSSGHYCSSMGRLARYSGRRCVKNNASLPTGQSNQQLTVGHLVFLWSLVPRAFLARQSITHIRWNSKSRQRSRAQCQPSLMVPVSRYFECFICVSVIHPLFPAHGPNETRSDHLVQVTISTQIPVEWCRLRGARPDGDKEENLFL